MAYNENGVVIGWWSAGVAYVISTSEGSVLMMKHLLKTESGKRKVGA
jgi:hypothetical protein